MTNEILKAAAGFFSEGCLTYLLPLQEASCSTRSTGHSACITEYTLTAHQHSIWLLVWKTAIQMDS